eukprot:gene43855-898_t
MPLDIPHMWSKGPNPYACSRLLDDAHAAFAAGGKAEVRTRDWTFNAGRNEETGRERRLRRASAQPAPQAGSWWDAESDHDADDGDATPPKACFY